MTTNQEDMQALRKHENDSGSTGVQIARLNHSIKYLNSCLHKKDKHSRRGLILKVSKMRKLIKYMQETDPSGYETVKNQLGLRR